MSQYHVSRSPGDKKRIVVTPGWTDLNKGDSAILLGTVQLLKKCWPSARITLLSEFGAGDYRASRVYHQHLLSNFPDVEIAGALFPITPRLCRPDRIPSRPRRLLQAICALFVGTYVLVTTVLFRRWAWLFLPKNVRRAWCAIADADLLVVKGGGFLVTDGSLTWNLWGLFRLLLPVFCARVLGVPYGMLPMSFAFKAGNIGALLLGQALGRASFVCAREPRSVAAAQKFVGRKTILMEVPDLAFLTKPSCVSFDMAVPSLCAAVVVRPWSFPGSPGAASKYEAYLNAFDMVINYLGQRGAKIYLIAQCLGHGPSEDDRVAIRDLVQRVAGRGNGYAISVIEQDYSPSELSGLYGSMDILVTARLHAAILAACAGVPSVAVAYHSSGKTEGIMAQLGLSNYVVRIERIDGSTLCDLIESLIAHRSRIRETLKQKVATLRHQSEQAVTDLLHSTSGRSQTGLRRC